jgi:MerR family transcriptional regulator, light-induced transcriptional regulator
MDRHAQMLGLANVQALDCDGFSPGPGLPAVAPAPALSSQERLSRIVRTIEADIIPRLVRAHRHAPNLPQAAPTASAEAPVQATPAEVLQLVELMLQGPDADWQGLLQGLLGRGLAVDDIYLGLLSPAAQELGRRWDDDRIPFTDVTVAVGRIQRIMRSLSPAFGAEVAHPADGRRVLLLPAPGEQHTFGLSMVAEFFRRAAWDVVGDESARSADPAALVRSEWFDVIGISAGSDARLDWLKSGITAVRNASRNRAIGILVGGPSFSVNPELAALVGADGTAVDGRQAPIMAEQLLQERLRRL